MSTTDTTPAAAPQAILWTEAIPLTAPSTPTAVLKGMAETYRRMIGKVVKVTNRNDRLGVIYRVDLNDPSQTFRVVYDSEAGPTAQWMTSQVLAPAGIGASDLATLPGGVVEMLRGLATIEESGSTDPANPAWSVASTAGVSDPAALRTTAATIAAAHNFVAATEPAALAVGDRVRVIRRSDIPGERFAEDGKCGVVTEVDPGSTALPARVQIDGMTFSLWVHRVERLGTATPTAPAPEQVAADALAVTAERDRLAEENASLKEQARVMRTQIAAHLRWRDDLVSDAHRYADDNDLCGTFDEFMEEHDLPRRQRSYTVTTHVTVEITVQVEAADEDGAISEVDQMEEGDLRQRILDAGRYDFEVIEHDAKEANPA